MLASEIVSDLKQSLGKPEHGKYESIVSGDVSIRVTGIATCTQPAMASLRHFRK